MNALRMGLVTLLALEALAPSPAGAQDVREVLEEDARAELDAIEAQRAIATGLYVGAGILLGGGVLTLVVGSSGTLACTPPEDCSPWEIAIAIGAISAGIGLPLLIVATFVEEGAGDRRRRVLRQSLSFGIGGPGVQLRLRF